SALAKPKSPQPDLDSNAVEEFAAPDGRTVSSQDPVVKAALLRLWKLSPRLVPFAELWSDVATRLQRSPDPVRDGLRQGPLPLAESLWACYPAGLGALPGYVPHFVLDPTEHPLASPLARLQAASDRLITNLRHASIELDPFDRAVLGHLDGTHDRQGLVKILTDLVVGDVLTVEVDGRPLKDPAQLRPALNDALGCSLDRLAASALLVA